jgi:hypothetical protein
MTDYVDRRQWKYDPMTGEPLVDGWPLYSGLPQPELEPVLWAAKESMFMWRTSDKHGHPYYIVCRGQKVQSHQIPLYTAPPQREWQGLTDDEIEGAYKAVYGSEPSMSVCRFADELEAKLKEKNT